MKQSPWERLLRQLWHAHFVGHCLGGSVVQWIVEPGNRGIAKWRGHVNWRLAANAVFKELNLNSNAKIYFGTCTEWRWQEIIAKMFSTRKFCTSAWKCTKIEMPHIHIHSQEQAHIFHPQLALIKQRCHSDIVAAAVAVAFPVAAGTACCCNMLHSHHCGIHSTCRLN